MTNILFQLAQSIGAGQPAIDELKGNGTFAQGMALDRIDGMKLAEMDQILYATTRSVQGVAKSKRSDESKLLGSLVLKAWQKAVKERRAAEKGTAPKAEPTGAAPKQAGSLANALLTPSPVMAFPASAAGNLDRALLNFKGATLEDWDAFFAAATALREQANPQPRVASQAETEALAVLAMVPAKKRDAARANLVKSGAAFHTPYTWQAGRLPETEIAAAKAASASTKPASETPVDAAKSKGAIANETSAA